MKPRALKKGDAVNIALSSGRALRAAFAFRNPPAGSKRDGDCYFIVAEFAGLDGETDTGLVALTDTAVRRCVERAR
jgi:hypothetical protein